MTKRIPDHLRGKFYAHPVTGAGETRYHVRWREPVREGIYTSVHDDAINALIGEAF